MPTLIEHAAKATHNETFFRGFDLDTTPYLDWVVVAVFYAALHLVEAFAATQGEHPNSHLERDRFLWASSALQPILVHYFHLKSDAEDARYGMRTFSPDEVKHLIADLFEPLKQHIASLPAIP
jgi:hypothetical protein